MLRTVRDILCVVQKSAGISLCKDALVRFRVPKPPTSSWWPSGTNEPEPDPCKCGQTTSSACSAGSAVVGGVVMSLPNGMADLILDLFEQARLVDLTWEQEQAHRRDKKEGNEPCFAEALQELEQIWNECEKAGIPTPILHRVLLDGLGLELYEHLFKKEAA